MSAQAKFQAVRARVAALQAAASPARGVLPFGDPRIDGVFPGGGLPLGRWHETLGEGLDMETGVAAAAFAAGLAAPLADRGALVWVMRRDDLHAPGLEALGLPAQRVIQVQVASEAEGFAALEEALASAGVAAGFVEAEAVDLLAGRRLQLACEKHGATGFVIRRRPFGGGPAREASGSASATRWRIAPAPSEPAAGEPGLGAPRWRVALERCRGGRPGEWLMEKADGTHALRVVAQLGDRQLAPPQPLRRAG